MPKLPAVTRSTNVSRRSFRSFLSPLVRWSAIAVTAVLCVQIALSVGTRQRLKRIYAQAHAHNQFHPEANGTGATGTPGVTSFDVPAASQTMLSGTIAVGIDAAGDVGGVYLDAKAVRHGFVRSASGTFTTFDAPGATTSQNYYSYGQGTIPLSMDAAGDIVGFYGDSTGLYHGFVRTAAGVITAIDFPGANAKYGGQGTIATGINATGTVTGYYKLPSPPNYSGPSPTSHGFVRTASGIFTSFDAPSATASYYGTQPFSINAQGDVTGMYTDATGAGHHGFVRLADGTLTQFDAPGAAVIPGCTQTPPYTCPPTYARSADGTIATGIDAAGDITGVYSDSKYLSHGFVRTANGAFTTFDVSGAGTTASAFKGIAQIISGTGGVAINSSGTITGAYEDANSLAHGYIRSASGTITTFDAPGAGTGTGGYQGTGGISINATGAVAGTYLDQNSVFHGFILSGTTVSVTPASASITTAQSLSVTVTVAGGTTTPTGSVVLAGGGYTSAATTLSSGSANINIPAGSLAVGTDTLTATYTPDAAASANHAAASAASVVTVTVPPAAATTLTLTANPTSSTYGQQVALVGTLNPYTGTSGNTNGQTVTFYNGTTMLGTGTLTSGVANLNVTALPAGTDTLRAVYAGDANFAASASTTVSFVVTPVAPTITFTVPAHTVGDSPFAVAATSNSGGALTYSVVSGPATISGSTVTLTGKGTVVVQASEVAAGNFAAATQTASFVVAGQAQTITFNAPASPVNYGAAPVALSGSASSGLGVTFSVLSGPASVSGSTLTISGAGTVVVAADQAGNTSYAAAAEVTRSITVNKIAPTVSLTSNASTLLAQSPLVLTATLGSTVSAPTGSVVFLDGTTTIGTSTVSGTGATLNIATLAAGAHTITAMYSGDANFTALTSSTVSETVQDFAVAATTSATSQTVKKGGAVMYVFAITPAGVTTVPATVTFTATGLPTGATATFSPSSVAAGSAATNVTLTVQTSATAKLEQRLWHDRGGIVAFAMLLLPFGVRMRRSGKRMRAVAALIFLAVGAGGMAMISGCAGNDSSASQTGLGTYNITVAATSGTLSHTTTVTLIVQ